MFKNSRGKDKGIGPSSVDRIKKAIRKNTACYVLITCSEPSQEGKMEVEMIYEGDESLAAYLVETAQSVFEGQTEESIDPV